MTSIQMPKCWADVELVLNKGIDRVILFGPPGTGKTFAGLNFGDVTAGSHRLICTDDMTNADVTGMMLQTENGTLRWSHGKALKAWIGNGQHGGRLVVDEIDKAGADVYATLLAMTDSEDSSEWENDLTGEKFKPNPGFSVVMTTNIEDMDDLPDALKDRFPVAIRIDQPHPQALMRISQDLRGYAIRMADAGTQRISLRTFMAFDQLRKESDEETAARIIFKHRSKEILEAIKIDRISIAKTAATATGVVEIPKTIPTAGSVTTVKRGRGRPRKDAPSTSTEPF